MAPRRTCIGCGKVDAPGPLARIVATPAGEVRWSESSAGRGAWLCADSPDCIERAKRRKAFGRALRTEIAGDPAIQLQAAAAGVRS